MSKIKDLIAELGIDETDTKKQKKIKKFTKVKDITYPEEDYNFMADLLELPKTKEGFKYLLVVVDLWTDEFDIEPLKTKTPKAILKAYEIMIERPHINLAKASIQTDGGTEFKGVFKKYLFKKSILKRTAMRGRHQQMGNVERLNQTLGRLFNGYMNKKEEETGKQYREWNDILAQVRTKLNKIRKKKPKINKFPTWTISTPKFKEGDLVQYRLGRDQAQDALGNTLRGGFRMGDRRFSKQVRKISHVLSYVGDVPIRYTLVNMPNVSFAEEELREATPTLESYKVRKIIGEKGRKYHVWWSGFKKADATYESKIRMKRDIPELVNEYETNKKLKK